MSEKQENYETGNPPLILTDSDQAQITTLPIAMPALTLDQAKQRYDDMVRFVHAILRKDIDYGVIPGTDKPSLLKPGAEKLTTFFGLRPKFICLDRTEDWDKGFFYYRYECQLWRDDIMIANGEGSCNSLEKKYRWRYVPTFAATAEEKAKALRTEKRKSKKTGKVFEVYVLENDDPFTLVNTLQKMAQKRALIAATLVAVNASEFFTQDIEDIIDAEFTEAPEPKPKHTQSPKRPAMPTVVKQQLIEQARAYREKGKTGEPSPQARGLMAGKLAEAHPQADQARHLFLEYVFGKTSSKELDRAEVGAVLNWLLDGQDPDTNDYVLNDNAVQELAMIVREQLLAHGQTTFAEAQ